MASLPEGARCGADLILKLDAQAFEPVDLVHRVGREVLHELRRSLVVAALHRLVVELLDRVLDALLALTDRVNGVQSAFGHIGRAPEEPELLEHENVLRARFFSSNGSGKTRSAAAHDDNVGLVGLFNRRMLLDLLAQRLHVAARLLEAVANALKEREARNGRAGNGVNACRLVVEHFLAHEVERNLADADRFQILGIVDLLNAVLRHRHLDGHRRIVAVDGRFVDAGLEGARRRGGCICRRGSARDAEEGGKHCFCKQIGMHGHVFLSFI